jgi:ATP-dependent helicase/nuclease subunit B
MQNLHLKNSKKKLYNIPANYHFLESLAEFLLEEFSLPDLAQVKLFLPNRRSAREFQNLLTKKITNQNSSVILPKIKAIGDLSFEDFIDNFSNQEILNQKNENLSSSLAQIIEETTKIKVGSPLEISLFLSKRISEWQEITKFFGKNLSSSQALNLATNLFSLFNQIDKEELDLSKLLDIDDSEISIHRQFILQFLQKFYFEVKNSLLKDNLVSYSYYQNLIINRYIEFLKEFASPSPIIIAGSTGAVTSTKRLIKSVLELKNGQIIIYGLDNCELTKCLDNKNYPQNHPQFILNNLVSSLKVNKADIIEIKYNQYLLSENSRREFISLTMLPFEKVNYWQDLATIINSTQLEKSLKNVTLINARDEICEAKIITLALKKAKFENKKCGLITNNRRLISLVKLELRQYGLKYNDSTNLNVSGSKLINFILLILELLENFDSHKFLTLLNHNLFYGTKEDFILHLRKFELEILRKPRCASDFEAIEECLKTLGDLALLNNLQPIFKIFFDLKISLKSIPSLAEFSKKIIAALEVLTKKNLEEILESEAAGEEIAAFWSNILKPTSIANDIKINQLDVLPLFKTLLMQISYFEKPDLNCLIQILSPREARLLNHDLVIVSSLNEGTFPEISPENWLGRKIKKELGIDEVSKKIGINSYDFCNYFCNSEVILIRSIKVDSSLATPSRFILKLQSLAKKAGINFNDGSLYRQILNQINDPRYICKIDENKQNLTAKSLYLNPKPAIEHRPQSYAITEISKLIRDPYTIYVKKILKLKPLNKIDYEPANAEFGSFIHEILDKFIKSSPKKCENFLEQIKPIFNKYFPAQESELIWWPKCQNIFNSFLKSEKSFIDVKNYTELPIELKIKIQNKEITINGKIDRLIFDNEGNLTIIDYKTGMCPTINQVISGVESQLLIAALALVNSSSKEFPKISLDKIRNLQYLKLAFNQEHKFIPIFKNDNDLKMVIHAASKGLEALFTYFFNLKNGYISYYDQELYQENEYKYLARIDEYNL